MEGERVDVSPLERQAEQHLFAGRTVLFVARNGRPQGIIVFANAIRPGAKKVFERLRKSGISHLVLVSGDTEAAVRAISQELGFDEYKAPLLPNEKAQFVASLEAGHVRVLMVGDGVNDALALSKATVGIAMGAGGSEVAMEAADITLAKSDLNDLVFLRLLSRKALTTIEQNFWLANSTNIFGILAGFGGLLSPAAAGLLHVGHTLAIMLNSSRLLTWRPDNTALAPISSSGGHGEVSH
jgi:cation-transporting P-type ATPase C